MATHNWNANYRELLSLLEIPTLETRRLELKLGHLFQIVHNLCFFPQEIIKFREQNLFLATHVLFILYNFINHEHIQIHTMIRLYPTQLMNLLVHPLLIFLSLNYKVTTFIDLFFIN